MGKKANIICLGSITYMYKIPGAGIGAGIGTGGGGCIIPARDISDGSDCVGESRGCKAKLGVDWEGWNIGWACIVCGGRVCIGACCGNSDAWSGRSILCSIARAWGVEDSCIGTSLLPSVTNILPLKRVDRSRSSGDTTKLPVDICSLQYSDSSLVLRLKKASLSQLG